MPVDPHSTEPDNKPYLPSNLPMLCLGFDFFLQSEVKFHQRWTAQTVKLKF